jgi:hypothetical protein
VKPDPGVCFGRSLVFEPIIVQLSDDLQEDDLKGRLQKVHQQTVARRIDRAVNNRIVLVEKFNVALFATRFSASSPFSQGTYLPSKDALESTKKLQCFCNDFCGSDRQAFRRSRFHEASATGIVLAFSLPLHAHQRHAAWIRAPAQIPGQER